jgi:hypothetical protein
MKHTNSLRSKLSTLFVLAALCSFALTANAQSYTQTSAFDTIRVNNDTLNFFFTSPPANAYGNTTLTVFFEGDFGSTVEYIDIYGENWGFLGSTGNSPSNNDCNVGLDSMSFSVPASLINAWGAGGDTIKFYGVISPNVDYFCTTNHARARLNYNYCLSPNAQTAAFTMPTTSFCPNDGAVTLSATPAGGSFSGPGVTGTTFDPEMLTAGSYSITYTVTDSTGCTSSAMDTAVVKSSPMVTGNSGYICNGDSALLSATGADYFVWYSDAALTNVLDTTVTGPFVTPVLSQATTYYVAGYDSGYVFIISSLNEMDSLAIDHDLLSGDDRGGIAVTNNYVYVVGDNNTVRFDLDLNPATGISLPVNDGIFSNLADGKLYSIYDGSAIPMYPSTYNFSQIVELDDSLNLTSNIITLSQPIPMGSNLNYSGIFAGYNLLIVYSGNNQRWYAIDLTDGDVEDLGFLASPQFYGSENWSVWGIAEFDGINYSVVFNHSNYAEIHRRVLPAQASTLVHAFANLSDMSSITYSPLNNRWYFHHEGGSQFGSFNEAVGYASASHTISSAVTNPAFDCVREVEVAVGPEVTIGAVASTVCVTDAPLAISVSPAGGTLAGPGVTGNAFDPSIAGIGTHTITYSYTDTNNCSASATTSIVVDACTSVEENAVASFNVYPNPNNGMFSLDMNVNAAADVNVEVITVEGRTVHAASFAVNAGKFTAGIDIAHLASGIYYLRIVADGQPSVIKLVKQN